MLLLRLRRYCGVAVTAALPLLRLRRYCGPNVLIRNLQKFTIQKCKCNFMAAIENST